MSEEIYRHPETGKELHRDVRTTNFEYHGIHFDVDMPGWYPDDDSDAIFTKEDMQIYSKALNRMKAIETGLLGPEEIARIRQKLHLSQIAAGTILGGGKRAFQKYESGTILPSRSISNLLRILDADPDALDILKKS